MGGHGWPAYGRQHVLSLPVAISVCSTCASPSRKDVQCPRWATHAAIRLVMEPPGVSVWVVSNVIAEVTALLDVVQRYPRLLQAPMYLCHSSLVPADDLLAA
jgi:hypothetical protein